MLTDHEVIAELSLLRERGADIEYTRDIPLTRRSAAATVVPVAALAAAATLGASAVIGSGTDGSRAGGSSTENGEGSGSGETRASREAGSAAPGVAVRLASASITLGGKTIAYRHVVGADPFAHGWQKAVEFGTSLPEDTTRFLLPNGDAVWVGDASGSTGNSVLIVTAGPRDSFYGAPSTFGRQDLEDFVRTSLRGQ